MAERSLSNVALVAIGRNEGERLRKCLESIPTGVRAVYVDSGSADGSVDLARGLGAEVVELDMSTPFTAARARNAGIDRCLLGKDVEFIQVVDGDCELASGFIESALSTMSELPRAAIVCGRRRERFRDATIYNALCDMEWNTPIGEADACGGDALLRVAALREVSGYDPAIIAGEEPELCWRLRQKGWTVHRIDREMTLHDAAITSFDGWWKRSVRAGHAYAELFARHRYWGREVASIVAYALVVPVLAFGAIPPSHGVSLLLLGAYGWLYLRVKRNRLAKGDDARDAKLYARYTVIGKFAQLRGMAKYVTNRITGKAPRIIEYKGPEHSTP